MIAKTRRASSHCRGWATATAKSASAARQPCRCTLQPAPPRIDASVHRGIAPRVPRDPARGFGSRDMPRLCTGHDEVNRGAGGLFSETGTSTANGRCVRCVERAGEGRRRRRGGYRHDQRCRPPPRLVPAAGSPRATAAGWSSFGRLRPPLTPTQAQAGEGHRPELPSVSRDAPVTNHHAFHTSSRQKARSSVHM